MHEVIMLIIISILFLVVMFGMESLLTSWSGSHRRKQRLSKLEKHAEKIESIPNGKANRIIRRIIKHLDQLLI